MVKFKSIQQFTQEDVRSPGDVFRSLTMCFLPPSPRHLWEIIGYQTGLTVLC